jgi:glycosyltransferase involved in cell wall biosynthesis
VSAAPVPRTVLYLHSSSGRYGADRQLLLLASGLDPARYRPLVVLPVEGDLTQDLREAGIEVVVRPLAVVRRELMSPRGLLALARARRRDAAELPELMRRHDVALVHTNTSVTLGGFAPARRMEVPHVVHVREIYAGFGAAWPVWRRVLSRADALACVSEAVRAQFGPFAGARVIHDGLPDTPARAPRATARAALDLPADAFVCAVLGRISSWKGQEVLVRALARPALRDTNVIAVIAGAAWPGQEQHLKRLLDAITDAGVSDRVRLVGFRDDVENIYGAADAVVVPSTAPDPLPNAALEAAAAGCCVVASNHGGLPEIVRDGETGILFLPGDADALAAALAGLIADPVRVAQLGTVAAADVCERFAPALLLERTQALYDELLAG